MSSTKYGTSGGMFVPVHARACDDEGEPAPTICFTFAYASHPHHHKLNCGHDIRTLTLQTCGANCHLAEDADSKPKGAPFTCPHGDCLRDRDKEKRRAAHFIPRRGRRSSLGFRKCELSHVYGIDEEADAQRQQEKTDQALNGLQGIDMRNDRRRPRTRAQDAQLRRRSRSPVRRNPRFTKAKRAEVDEAEILNGLAKHDVGHRIAMSFSGPGVRPKKDGRFMTKNEIQQAVRDARITALLDSLQVMDDRKEILHRLEQARARERRDQEHQRREEKARARAKGKQIAGPNTATFLDVACDAFDEPVINVRYRCCDCPQQPGYDLCENCYDSHFLVHMQGEHTFIALATSAVDTGKPAEDNVDMSEEHEEDTEAIDSTVGFEQEPDSFCHCTSFATEYLVECHHCSAQFHPGCHGLGCYENDAYVEDHPQREACLKYDYRRANEGKAFTCMICTGVKSAALATFEDRIREKKELRALRRDIARERMAMERYYNPQQAVAKRNELKRATSAEDREAIEAKYQALAVQQAQEQAEQHDGLFGDTDAGGEGDGDEGSYGTFYNMHMPVRLKPGME